MNKPAPGRLHISQPLCRPARVLASYCYITGLQNTGRLVSCSAGQLLPPSSPSVLYHKPARMSTPFLKKYTRPTGRDLCGDLLACQRDPPLYRTILGTTDSVGSPHEGLGGRSVEASLPSHLAPLRPSLDFDQSHGEGLVVDFVSDQASVPSEERLRHARGEGDPKHLPGFRGYLPPSYEYILTHLQRYVNTFLKKIFVRTNRAGPRLRWIIHPPAEPASYRQPRARGSPWHG